MNNRIVFEGSELQIKMLKELIANALKNDYGDLPEMKTHYAAELLTMTIEEIKSNLCYYDLRNPEGTSDEDEIKEHEQKLEKESQKKGYKVHCSCDNCFYGLTPLATELLKYKS